MQKYAFPNLPWQKHNKTCSKLHCATQVTFMKLFIYILHKSKIISESNSKRNQKSIFDIRTKFWYIFYIYSNIDALTVCWGCGLGCRLPFTQCNKQDNRPSGSLLFPVVSFYLISESDTMFKLARLSSFRVCCGNYSYCCWICQTRKIYRVRK